MIEHNVNSLSCGKKIVVINERNALMYIVQSTKLFCMLNYLVDVTRKFLSIKVLLITPKKQFLWIKETFLWYKVKEKISLNWRKFCWFKKIFFNVNKSISLDRRKFVWINKSFFNSKKVFPWPYIKEMFHWFKETVFSVQTKVCLNCLYISVYLKKSLNHITFFSESWIKCTLIQSKFNIK